MVELFLERRFLDSQDWQPEKLINISGSQIIACIGSSVPELGECRRNTRGEYLLGSICYNLSYSEGRDATLTIGCRTDEAGAMVDVEVKLQDNQIKKDKEVFTDFPFHHTPPADAERGFELRLKIDDQAFEVCTFEGERIRKALEERKENSQENPDKKEEKN